MSGTIGERLRRARRERGMTREDLARAAGVSVDLISKLEQGRRESARITTLAKLANALDLEIPHLLDRRDRLGPDRDGGSVLAVRDVLLSPSLLPGMDTDDDGEPTPLDELERSVSRAWDHYWAGDFGEVLASLPNLVGEARVTHSAVGTAAVRPLALAYALASNLMAQIGRTDLGLVAAERAITVAHTGDDMLLWATMHAEYAWVLLHQGRYAESEKVAADMAARIEPSFGDGEKEIAAWGNLLMTAVAPAVGQDRTPEEYLRPAGAGAERLGRRVRVYHTSFAPPTVAMQATYAYSILKKPAEALKAAKRIRPPSKDHPGDLRGISWGAHLMDVAQAHFDAGRLSAATTTLLEAQQVSPVWFRHQRIAQALTRDIRETEKRLSPATRRLTKALGVED
ncbi:helix-turn-helix domain-containing protein [Actinomadura keratinilytica]|jgi:transcriptional regulator with XRE-family HTH domain|uniref:HTH cro/C1-type domain-containing protein n=1 Tax=Actinomadura keratinilytica TaxID=547461 RepID=A0ABP7Z2U9_9ACTN